MIHEGLVESASGEYARKVWLLSAAEPELASLCVILDAEFYLGRMNIVPALPAGIAYVFVSHVDGGVRHEDYVCNPRYASFVVHEVVDWARERVPSLPRFGHTICGLSLSGLEAAFISLTSSAVFPQAVCQSPSFWWNDEWLTDQVEGLSSRSNAFWLSVGDNELEAGVSHPPTGLRQEVSQRVSVERGVEALRRAEHHVHFEVFQGGHELGPWERELPRALAWVFEQGNVSRGDG